MRTVLKQYKIAVEPFGDVFPVYDSEKDKLSFECLIHFGSEITLHEKIPEGSPVLTGVDPILKKLFTSKMIEVLTLLHGTVEKTLADNGIRVTRETTVEHVMSPAAGATKH